MAASHSNPTLVVVAEGAELPGGTLVVQESAINAQVRLGGLGEIVAKEIQTRMGVEARCVVLGHLQRGGSPLPMSQPIAPHLDELLGPLPTTDSSSALRAEKNGTECRSTLWSSPELRLKKALGQQLVYHIA